MNTQYAIRNTFHVAMQSHAAQAACPGRRIVVIGTSGSGKTTLARHLSACLGIPHVELDALHWEPGGTEAPTEVLRKGIPDGLADDEGVGDGNYSMVRHIVWTRAETRGTLYAPLGG